ncbi:DUF1801 domain-containing protein [Dactylosporangium sp. AC04546]|uniref:iron chaperone n=1 Tax=Dactylosporangium sp. AC04546 TaxID=2862460 RepID=UPI001EDD23DC|nr:DUF1801 domain-containing protein [Dactylosporangium sp. AC04546]WVK79717.1 DUF1801 domain-containing protein [Dactylosporangium sp. AC04546]
MSAPKKATKKTAASDTLSDEERAAVKERAKELRSKKGADEEPALLAKIAEMEESDRVMAERIHAIVKANAPGLTPTTWYGMPAYARNGKAVCFFQPAKKFKSRYSTLGFNDPASLDDGVMWPTAFALTEVTDEAEARIAALVKKAAS